MADGVTSPPRSVVPEELCEALGETGAIGATVQQLARRLDEPPPYIAAALATLEAEGEVLHHGRGLWVLHAFGELASRSDFVSPEDYTERFARENGVTLGRYRGPITFASNETLPIHRWWPYVQGYSAEFVRSMIEEHGLQPGETIFDPFAGSGTTLVEGRRAGLHAVGCELLPPAALAAQVKTYFELSPRALVMAWQRYRRNARRARPASLPFLRETARQFSPEVLARLGGLRAALPPQGAPVNNALRVAFGRILIPVSQLHRSPCLGYRRTPAENPLDPYEELDRVIGEMAEDLRRLAPEHARWGPSAEVQTHDARSVSLRRGSVAIAVTSPPYVNGMDYVMNYKLDLAWLGYARSYADLAALRQAQVACDNLPRAEAAPYLSIARVPDPWLREILARIQRNVARKGSYRRNDVHGIVSRYFWDLVPVLRRVRESLRPGGQFLVVVGDSLLAGAYVPGDLLLARLGASLGFRIAAVDVARGRRSGQRRSFRLRESIVTLERPRTSTGAV
ncbi:MAG: DNA methyltransferase [Thermoplasmata archaeon]